MNKWYENLNRAPFSPPNYVFGIVWPILYGLMAISFILVWQHKKCFPYCSALTLFLAQLAFNLLWTTLFFRYKMPMLALLDLIFILYFTLLTFFAFIKISKLAAYLLVPYICWLCVALYLNAYIVIYN